MKRSCKPVVIGDTLTLESKVAQSFARWVEIGDKEEAFAWFERAR